MFGGPRLDSVIHNGRIALIGDASHPLSGAFGSGAAFAFEDAYVLAQALAYTHSRDENISEALKLYDEVRYARSMPSSTALQTLQVKCKSLMARRMKTNLSERPLDATGLPTKIGSIPTM